MVPFPGGAQSYCTEDQFHQKYIYSLNISQKFILVTDSESKRTNDFVKSYKWEKSTKTKRTFISLLVILGTLIFLFWPCGWVWPHWWFYITFWVNFVDNHFLWRVLNPKLFFIVVKNVFWTPPSVFDQQVSLVCYKSHWKKTKASIGCFNVTCALLL